MIHFKPQILFQGGAKNDLNFHFKNLNTVLKYRIKSSPRINEYFEAQSNTYDKIW